MNNVYPSISLAIDFEESNDMSQRDVETKKEPSEEEPKTISLDNREFVLEIETANLILQYKDIDEAIIKRLRDEITRKINKVRSELPETKSSSPIEDGARMRGSQELLEMCLSSLSEVQTDNDCKKILSNIKLGYSRLIENYVRAGAIYKAKLEVSGAFKKELSDLKEDFKESLGTIQKLSHEIKKHEREKREMEKNFERERNRMKLLLMEAQEVKASRVMPEVKQIPEPKVIPDPKPIVKEPKEKKLSLTNLKSLIKDIYAKKQKYDLVCLNTGNPKQSMEQYLYTYLKTNKESKGSIIEWTQVILSHLEKYSQTDPEVALFGKILRNECEEAFRYKIEQTKSIVEELVRKRLNVIKEEYKEYIKENNSSDELCGELVNKICETGDRKLVLAKIREKAGEEGKMSQFLRRITIEEVECLLLEYVLAKHDIAINRFIGVFRQINKTGSGTFNHYEFKELLKYLNLELPNKTFNRMIEILDPYKNEKIIFSDCLSLFETVVLILIDRSR
jgi:hypothetical protein